MPVPPVAPVPPSHLGMAYQQQETPPPPAAPRRSQNAAAVTSAHERSTRQMPAPPPLNIKREWKPATTAQRDQERPN